MDDYDIEDETEEEEISPEDLKRHMAEMKKLLKEKETRLKETKDWARKSAAERKEILSQLSSAHAAGTLPEQLRGLLNGVPEDTPYIADPLWEFRHSIDESAKAAARFNPKVHEHVTAFRAYFNGFLNQEQKEKMAADLRDLSRSDDPDAVFKKVLEMGEKKREKLFSYTDRTKKTIEQIFSEHEAMEKEKSVKNHDKKENVLQSDRDTPIDMDIPSGARADTLSKSRGAKNPKEYAF